MSRATAWMSIGISTVAVALSLFALLFTRIRDRRDLFLKMHERMVDSDVFRGRQLLFERIQSVDDVVALKGENGEDYRAINRSLAMLDIFALYAQRGYIDRELLLSEWGFIYVLAWRHGQYFAEARTSDLGLPSAPWRHLQAFQRDARLRLGMGPE